MAEDITLSGNACFPFHPVKSYPEHDSPQCYIKDLTGKRSSVHYIHHSTSTTCDLYLKKETKMSSI